MLILPNSRFLCCPKTASQFCSCAIKSAVANVVPHELEPDDYHAGLDDLRGSELPSFGFVRHPVTWYESYWRYRMTHGWESLTHDIDEHCRSHNLEVFVNNVVEMYPGWLSRGFEHWLGPDLSSLAFVGRYENVINDLCEALTKFGETFDERTIRSHARVNVGDRSAMPAEPLTERLKERIEASEHRIIERFYSTTTAVSFSAS